VKFRSYMYKVINSDVIKLLLEVKIIKFRLDIQKTKLRCAKSISTIKVGGR
jgi:hypothetical protein